MSESSHAESTMPGGVRVRAPRDRRDHAALLLARSELFRPVLRGDVESTIAVVDSQMRRDPHRVRLATVAAGFSAALGISAGCLRRGLDAHRVAFTSGFAQPSAALVAYRRHRVVEDVVSSFVLRSGLRVEMTFLARIERILERSGVSEVESVGTVGVRLVAPLVTVPATEHASVDVAVDLGAAVVTLGTPSTADATLRGHFEELLGHLVRDDIRRRGRVTALAGVGPHGHEAAIPRSSFDRFEVVAATVGASGDRTLALGFRLVAGDSGIERDLSDVRGGHELSVLVSEDVVGRLLRAQWSRGRFSSVFPYESAVTITDGGPPASATVHGSFAATTLDEVQFATSAAVGVDVLVLSGAGQLTVTGLTRADGKHYGPEALGVPATSTAEWEVGGPVSLGSPAATSPAMLQFLTSIHHHGLRYLSRPLPPTAGTPVVRYARLDATARRLLLLVDLNP